jgi:hypothetical protein
MSSTPYTPPNMGFQYDTHEDLNDFIIDCLEGKAFALNGHEQDEYLMAIAQDKNFLKQECLEYIEYFVDGHKTFINALMNTLDFEKVLDGFKRVFEADLEDLLKPDEPTQSQRNRHFD